MFRSVWFHGEEEYADIKTEAAEVKIPEFDPVYGRGGPLVQIWKDALVK